MASSCGSVASIDQCRLIVSHVLAFGEPLLDHAPHRGDVLKRARVRAAAHARQIEGLDAFPLKVASVRFLIRIDITKPRYAAPN